MSDVTQILNQIESGDPSAADQLLPLVYDELRKLAAAKLANEKPGQTLQATGLVHEAYLRLVGGAESVTWNSRAHFFGAAAEAMRRILVERARRKSSLKAGATMSRVEISQIPDDEFNGQKDLLALSDALGELESVDRRAAELVKLRFFAGLTRKQAAGVFGVSLATVDKDWAYAKSWLKLKISCQ